MTAINVTIDELILHGFDAADRQRIGDAVRLELSRLLSASPDGRSDQFRNVETDRIDSGTIRIDSGSAAASIGARVAGAIHAAIADRNAPERSLTTATIHLTNA